MNLGPQMAEISVDNQRCKFNTGPYRAPLKNRNFLKLGHLVGEERQIHKQTHKIHGLYVPYSRI